MNDVTLIGRVESVFTYDHTLYGENFYLGYVSIKRTSGTYDKLPVIISDRLLDVDNDYTGKYVQIRGEFRSHNRHDEDKTRLILYVFVLDISLIAQEVNVNDVLLEGTICKTPTYRETPLGREIADIILAVAKGYGKSDYIPCIAWGRNASYLGSMKAGTKLRITGRIQSREYTKNGETKTAYEVSISLLESV